MISLARISLLGLFSLFGLGKGIFIFMINSIVRIDYNGIKLSIVFLVCISFLLALSTSAHWISA